MTNIQQQLFKAIKAQLPSYSVLENEVAKLLKVDLAVAFELVRNQKTLELSAAVRLANHFGISLNHLEQNTPTIMPFQYIAFNYNVHQLEDYFRLVLAEFQKVDMFGAKKMVYVASELPLFSLFQFPELAAFKLFFWGKTVYNLPEFKNKRFDVNFLNDELVAYGETMWEAYLKFPSTEIWSSNIVNDVLTQIYFFWKYRIFKNKKDAILICDKLSQLLDHVEMQARVGKKFHPQRKLPQEENYSLYYNDVSVSNNTIWVQSTNRNIVFVSQNALNYLTTDNEIFVMQMSGWVHQLQQNSIKISSTNDQLRRNFFLQMKGNIDFIKQEIQAGR
jgi:hypothetical protein